MVSFYLAFFMLSEVAEKCDDCELWGSSCLQQLTGKPNNLDLEIALNVQKSSTDIQCVCMSHVLFLPSIFHAFRGCGRR